MTSAIVLMLLNPALPDLARFGIIIANTADNVINGLTTQTLAMRRGALSSPKSFGRLGMRRPWAAAGELKIVPGKTSAGLAAFPLF